MKQIPYGRQDVTTEDIAAVTEVLTSDWLTQGPAVPRFEAAVADYCGANHAVAVNSATSALHIACLAIGLGRGDRLWTSPNTFVASANCGLYCGALVDFVDIDPQTYNMSATALAQKLAGAKIEGKLPKVVIPVHFAGQSCDMGAIFALSQEYGFRVIEDASHAVGGRYQGRPIGCCQYSDIAVFSFHPVKIITTAEGGMALCNTADLSSRMELLRSHGVTRDPTKMTSPSEGPWYYQQIALGMNYRMTELHAALGASQMTRLDDYVARRHQLADIYDRSLASLPVITPFRHAASYSAMHLYVIRLKKGAIPGGRRRVFEALRENGVGVNVHYIPVHLQPYYRHMGFGVNEYPEAESYYEDALSLPMFPTMTSTQQDEVIEALREALM